MLRWSKPVYNLLGGPFTTWFVKRTVLPRNSEDQFALAEGRDGGPLSLVCRSADPLASSFCVFGRLVTLALLSSLKTLNGCGSSQVALSSSGLYDCCAAMAQKTLLDDALLPLALASMS